MLQALADATARPASELARIASVSPQTASTHLARLVEGQLLAVQRQGRHRYYRLRDARVAELLEFVASFAPVGPLGAPGARPADRYARDLRFARTCYKHLAGHVGVAVTEGLCARKLLRETATEYEVSEDGLRWFSELGIEVHALRSKPLTRLCLDWSERRYHLGGSLGAALGERLLALHWLARRREGRALRLTELGRRELDQALALKLDTGI